MSGYLQRLTRSVTQPAETLHSMLGSVFSPVNYGRAADALEHNVAVPSSEVAAASPEQPQEVGDSRLPQTRFLPPVAAASPAPLITKESTNLGSRTSDEILFQPLITAAPTEHSTTERKPALDAPLESRQRDNTQQFYTPLMTEAPVRTRPQETAPAPLKPNRALRGKEDGDASRRPEREPDEIQIHIGRIEVTAVQQAPARAPLKTIHKGQSLDEYLTRRDRRA